MRLSYVKQHLHCRSSRSYVAVGQQLTQRWNCLLVSHKKMLSTAGSPVGPGTDTESLIQQLQRANAPLADHSDQFPSQEEWLESNPGSSLEDYNNALYERGRHLNMIERMFKPAFAIFAHLASNGHSGGMNNVGLCLQEGEGCEKDAPAGFEWIKKSATCGFPKGMYNLGVSHIQGIGTPKDPALSAHWYTRAAERGYAPAFTNLGLLYKNGEGVERDYKKAVKYYELGFKAGDITAYTNLGWMWENGCGVPKDSRKAIELYELAAAEGNSVANYNLGIIYETGKSGARKDLARAVKYYEIAAEQNDASALCNLGALYEFGNGVPQDYERALVYYELSAEQGHVHALHNLGVKYAEGAGVVKDNAKAVSFYERAAVQDHASSLCNLGYMKQHGLGCEKDAAKAIELYRRSADRGDVIGALNTGIVYEYGRGTPIDLWIARKYYAQAARAENKDAVAKFTESSSLMDAFYFAGQNHLKVNEREAMRCFRVAAAILHPRAVIALDTMYSNAQGLQPEPFDKEMRYLVPNLPTASVSGISSLPSEILDLIFVHIHPVILCRLRSASRAFRNHFDDTSFARSNLRQFVLSKYSRARAGVTKAHFFDKMLLFGPHAYQTAYLELYLNDTETEIMSTNRKYLTLARDRLLPIPTAYRTWTSLTRVNLHKCGLEGTIPESISSLVSVRHLDISENALEGGIPSSMAEIIALETLYLNSNDLSGVIEEGIHVMLEGLTAYSLRKNRLKATRPNFKWFVKHQTPRKRISDE